LKLQAGAVMLDGKVLTLWTIRAAAALYAASVIAWMGRRDRMARLTWSLACLLYLAHVGCAFTFYHHWSHSEAYEDTAKRTAELLGTGWGGGLYFNYVFTAAWIVDAIWWWRGLAVYRKRPPWIQTSVHAFFAFMFFNAVVVFAAGPVRWLGIVATATLGLVWWRSRSWSMDRASSDGGTNV
jgi:hypothetical protein